VTSGGAPGTPSTATTVGHAGRAARWHVIASRLDRAAALDRPVRATGRLGTCVPYPPVRKRVRELSARAEGGRPRPRTARNGPQKWSSTRALRRRDPVGELATHISTSSPRRGRIEGEPVAGGRNRAGSSREAGDRAREARQWSEQARWRKEAVKLWDVGGRRAQASTRGSPRSAAAPGRRRPANAASADVGGAGVVSCSSRRTSPRSCRVVGVDTALSDGRSGRSARLGDGAGSPRAQARQDDHPIRAGKATEGRTVRAAKPGRAACAPQRQRVQQELADLSAAAARSLRGREAGDRRLSSQSAVSRIHEDFKR